MVDSRTALHRLMVETTIAELHDDMYVDEKTSSAHCLIAALSYHVPPTCGHTHAFNAHRSAHAQVSTSVGGLTAGKHNAVGG